MKTIILPGYSPRNKDWALDVQKQMDLGHEVVLYEWRHWTKSSFSMRRELDEIIKEVGKEKINIIAKSVGTRVVMKLIPEIKDQINKVILCGIPTKFTSEVAKKLYTDGLSHLPPTRLICFQNTKDPFANFKTIRDFIHSVNSKIKVIEKPRSDHHYPYSEDFQEFIAK